MIRAVGLLIVLVAAGAAAWWLLPNDAPGPATAVLFERGGEYAPPPGTQLVINPSGTALDVSNIDADVLPPEGYVRYENARFGFSFYHAPTSRVREIDEGGGAMTVVLENFERQRGIQVFIVPYAEATISEERFLRDVPSGIRQNVENATVDGVQAVTFNSFDQALGETREIWMIRNGFLYEITTFKGVGLWFNPFIQSWDFL